MKPIILTCIAICVATAALAQPKGPQSKAPVTPSVIVAPVRMGDFSDKIEALGTLRANETVTLTATITEAVTAVRFDDGQRVKKGDVLVELSAREETADMDAEKATVREAQGQVARLGPLVKAGASSQSMLDQWQRELDTARARMRAIESRMGDRTIRAPFDGLVGLRTISVGTVLQPGTRITTVDDDSVMKLDFAIPSVYLSDIAAAVPIIATTDSFKGRIFDGKITSIDSQIDPITRAFMVRAVIPNDDKVLKPGLLMRIDILTNQRQAVIIPEGAIVSQGRDDFVYVVTTQDGKTTAAKRQVVIGSRRVGEVEIVKNLTVQDRVVTHGAMNIDDGATVTVKATDDGSKPIAELLRPVATKPASSDKAPR
ncbi:MAG: efflux RND transporter periplasmic adaptor subunit [Pseudomonadota bacterium]